MQRSQQISLNSVRIFALVAETQSVKHAAQRLGVTAGAVSRQIRNLEQTMGVSLFVRSNNAVSLTPTGETFFRHIQTALHS
ncbi:MAG: LysR family transcriptional regulator, partial [Pseudomonadota bacterium]